MPRLLCPLIQNVIGGDILTETKFRYEAYKEHADELRLKQRELQHTLIYGSEEDIKALRSRVAELQQLLRTFNEELEHYVPDDCPPSVRRRKLQEREFIKYYYIMGFTMDKSAEYMNLSRDTVYRIRTRLMSK